MLKQVLCASVMLTNKYKCKNNSYELLCNVVCRKNASKPDVPMYIYCTEDEIQTKVSRVFLRAIHSHLYSFALRFLFLQTITASYSFDSLVTVHCKGERRKTS